MDSRARDVLSFSNRLFGKKQVVNSLWQEIALNFYPERADFTDERHEGEEFSDHLHASYPVLARRELGNLMSANLRPQSQPWFSLHVQDSDLDEQSEERRFLEFMQKVQRRAMYDAGTGFVRATKEADHDYAAFGNAVIMATTNAAKNGLLYRSLHLRDCAWSDNADTHVDVLFHNEECSARQLKERFGSKVSKDVENACKKDPYKMFAIRRCVMPSRLYRYKSERGREFPYVSLIVERESETTLEEVGLNYFPFVIPRWQTVSGSSYGRSMATSIALPDGRTTQVVTRTLREAAEKYVDPPMIAIADAIRGDIPLYAGGITIAEEEYDERLGEVLRPISQNASAMPIGFEVAAALREDIRNAFFLDKIQLPAPENTDMTAFEVRRRIEEHIRAASPLFEPIEKDYNSPLCELTFNILMQNGAFPIDKMPEGLRGADIDFTFRSPLSDAAEQAEATIFMDGMTRIIAPLAQIDPAQMKNVNITDGVRDALKAIGFKAEWMNPIEQVEEERQKVEQMMQAQQMLAAGQQVGQVAEQGGKAATAINEATAQ